MKRTVKAWALLDKDYNNRLQFDDYKEGSGAKIFLCFPTREGARQERDSIVQELVVPCEIVFDSSQPTRKVKK